METVRDAKISAAFKACLLLYENNELNERLLPITQQECLSKVAVDLFKHWKKYQKIGVCVNISKRTNLLINN